MTRDEVQKEHDTFPFSAGSVDEGVRQALVMKNEYVCVVRDLPNGSPPSYFQKAAGELAYFAAVLSKVSRTKGLPCPG